MIEIVPAIDLIGGKAVRLTQGDYARKKEYGDPLHLARSFEDHGLTRLHLVDLDGAREKRLVNHHILEQIASRTSLVIDAGGGLRSDEDLHVAFESGAAMVTGGSIAVKDPALFLGWLVRYGADRIILGADYREGKIAVSGWEEATSLDLMEFLEKYMAEGIRRSICTDIAVDGMLSGPSLPAYKRIKAELPGLHLTASGGVSSMEDILNLEEEMVDAVILGKALYEGRIQLKDLEKHMINST